MNTSLIASRVMLDLNIPKPTPLSISDFEDKLLGTIFGNALGDAVGIRTEFLSTANAEEIWKNERNLTLNFQSRTFPKGFWSDDTDQLILILQTYLSDSTIPQPEFAKRLLNWARYGIEELYNHPALDIGILTRSVMSYRNFPEEPFQCALKVWLSNMCRSAPNGAVMRTSILGVINYQNLEQVIKQTVDMATVTHVDPRSVASAVALTTSIALMLQGHGWEEAYELGISISKRFITVYTDALRMLIDEHAKKQDLVFFDQETHEFSEELLERYLRGDFTTFGPIEGRSMGYTYLCIGCGFWAVRQNNWEYAIREIIAKGGDADTNAAVAGAILGCKVGYSNLPQSLASQLTHKKWLYKIAEELSKKMKLDYSSEELPKTTTEINNPS